MKLKTSRNVAGLLGSRLVCLKQAKTVYFSSYICGEERTRKRKKEDEQIKIFVFGLVFLTLLKVSGTFRVNLALE